MGLVTGVGSRTDVDALFSLSVEDEARFVNSRGAGGEGGASVEGEAGNGGDYYTFDLVAGGDKSGQFGASRGDFGWLVRCGGGCGTLKRHRHGELLLASSG